MSDKSQEKALAVLKETKENGHLGPTIEVGPAELIGAEERPRVKEVLEASATAMPTGRQADRPVAAEAEKRELTPEQADKLVSILKSRFDAAGKKIRKSIGFRDVEKSLRAAPEKLYALQKLEETGGEPQVVGIKGGEYIFEDRSEESPSGRRDMNADRAAAQADEIGADMQSPDAYKAMQKTGKYDLTSASWLKTDPEYRKRTGALYGYRRSGAVNVYVRYTGGRGPGCGWRASLRVKKV